MIARVAVFSARQYDRKFLSAAAAAASNSSGVSVEFDFVAARLTADTAHLLLSSTRSHQASDPSPDTDNLSRVPHVGVCAFINDALDRAVLTVLAAAGVRFVALRCAGFNQVDVAAAAELGIRVARVPKYSPEAVAEHAVALLLALCRKLPRALARVRSDDFSLDGLVGRNVHGSTVGVIGTGAIGVAFARCVAGFGVTLLAYDVVRAPEFERLGGRYVDSLDELLARADIVSLHCPLLPATRHLIDAPRVAAMKRGALLINTSRGAIVDTPALIAGLKSGQLAGAGIDVYEAEEPLFGNDLSDTVLQDDQFQLLQSFNNCLITAHCAFFTDTALANIAATTVANIVRLAKNEPPNENDVK